MMGDKRIIVGVSGASGVGLAVELLKALGEQEGIERHLVMTRGAELTMADEDISPEKLRELADREYDINDFGASISSGTYRTMGMVVIPCSMKTVAGINSGFSDNLLLRAADVTIKEQRKLVLVVRETPLSPIHLKNMLCLSQMGVVIMPAMMSFYNSISTAEDMKRHLIGKILDQFGLEHPGFKRWGEP
jgi:4-hydroxy-3-polyprenylbenzoate decarboxylase